MNAKSWSQSKLVVIPKRQKVAALTQPDPPCFTETISALNPNDRREARKWFKETLLNLREAEKHVIDYRENKGCAADTLDELIFLIDDLTARCIDLIERHPGIDDLGDGYRKRPEHAPHSFDQRKSYGKVILVNG